MLSGDEIDPQDFAYLYAKRWAVENDIPFDPEVDDPHEFVEKHEKDFSWWLDHENKLSDALGHGDDLPARYYFEKAKPFPADQWILVADDDTADIEGLATGRRPKKRPHPTAEKNLSDDLSPEERIYARGYQVDSHPNVGREGGFRQDRHSGSLRFSLVRTPAAVLVERSGYGEQYDEVIWPLGTESEEYAVWGDRHGSDWYFGTNEFDYTQEGLDGVIALAPLKDYEAVEAALIEDRFRPEVRKHAPLGWGYLVYEALLGHEENRDKSPQYIGDDSHDLTREVIRALNLYRRPTDEF